MGHTNNNMGGYMGTTITIVGYTDNNNKGATLVL